MITLDADTSLPHGSASRLVATLAHPLNQAEFAADGRSVVAGYTVLQPRVAIKPTSANRSLFSQIFAGNAGFDLYTLAVSDVYQDLFGEGSYVGKGIYDVAAFERSLVGQVRENTLLSHDLFEGIYGRAALVTDIILYEEYPARYLIYTRRLRRWIRGDWQLLPWLLPIVRTKTGFAPNRLSIINRWKIFDNLRRSLLHANHADLLCGCLVGFTRFSAGVDSANTFAICLADPGTSASAHQTKYWTAQPERTGRACKAPAHALGACDPLSALRSLAHSWRDSNHTGSPAHFAQEIAAMDNGCTYGAIVWVKCQI